MAQTHEDAVGEHADFHADGNADEHADEHVDEQADELADGLAHSQPCVHDGRCGCHQDLDGKRERQRHVPRRLYDGPRAARVSTICPRWSDFEKHSQGPL